jgi:hypothetical protein
VSEGQRRLYQGLGAGIEPSQTVHLNQCSIGREEHLTLKRLNIFVHGDPLLHFPLIVLSKIRDDRRGEMHPVFRATTRTRQVSCRRNGQRSIGLAVCTEYDATIQSSPDMDLWRLSPL